MFEDVMVLDFTQVIAGPFATMQLALQGADVIKIERPGGGDMMRSIMAAPPYSDLGTSAGFIAFNLSKRSLTLDLKSQAAREILAPLIARADVIVESFRPGVMAGLGLDAATIRARRPELVYCSISGHGQSGPKAGEPAFDGAIQAASGMMSVTGFADGDPLRAGYFAVDVPTGYAAAFAIAGGLLKARTTGEGSHIDVAMMDTALSLMAMQVSEYFQSGVTPARLGNMSAGRSASDNTYPTSDGAICVVALAPHQVSALHKTLALSEGADVSELAEAFRAASSAQWVARLKDAGVPCAVVRDLPSALADEQLKGRAILDAPPAPPGLVERLEDRPDGAPLKVIGSPFTVEPPPPGSRAAPALGQHTDMILCEIGFTPDQIDAWRQAGVV
ncbi:MAG TPA: CoA transferase [Alphaproteobacteria bacterium]|nr:CoA transferase [Alphaproteobacteria bacterium]